jgi:hypothetical protein
VVDSTNGNFICDPATHIVEPAYAAFSNSKILETAASNIFASGAPVNTNDESYAQVFAFQSFVSKEALNPNHEFANPSIDGVLSQSNSGQPLYFGCIQYWLSQQVLGGSVASPTYCTEPRPSWYIPYSNLP